MWNFTNRNIPGWADEPCYTAFYEGDVSTVLTLPDGETAEVREWDLQSDMNPYPIVTILKVKAFPQNEEEMKRLDYTLMRARHHNIRLVLPRGKYPPNVRVNIDSESYL
jgi:hypothetical protein